MPFSPSPGHAGEDGFELFDDTSGSNAEIRHNGTKFKIKVTKAVIQAGTDLLDATGEHVGNLTGNAVQDTAMKSLGQVKGRVNFEGHVADAQAIGLANLESSTNSVCDLKFLLGVGNTDDLGGSVSVTQIKNYIRFRLAIESVTINWDYTQPFIGLVVSGQITDEYAGTIVNPPIQEMSS